MALAPGTRLGPHEVLDLIGAGGMGEVYRARDRRLDRTVALKVLPSSVAADPGRRARFEREAKTISQLNHPHICVLYDVGHQDALDFLVMEYLAGETLAERLKRGPVPLAQALDLAAQIADALAAAHSQGIVHRDLKPGNIMLVRPGGPSDPPIAKLLDFGLAKLMAHGDQPALVLAESQPTASGPLTARGTILGTLPYMAPEQLEGKPADARTDLWALGTILYEMLAGRRPFGSDAGVSELAAILCNAPAPIATIAPAVARLVERCLRKDAAERFQSAADVKTAIEACVAPRTGREKPSVAVLPFTNMSGAKDDDYLCEGLSEEIINALTRISGLRVIARTSAFAVARMGLDIREAGARLDVGHILEGSVRRAGLRVRVTAQLITTNDGAHVWSERYDRELTDVLALEDEIASAIAERLRVELARDLRAQVRPVVDIEAHHAYLEGRYYFARGTPDALALAKARYERAIERDPTSALAHDSLAELYWYLGFFGGVPPRDAFSQSTWYALRALELDDTLAETHALLGMLRKELDYNWPEVDRELRRARELNPESPLVRLRYAISGLLPHGRLDESIAELEALVRTDPLSIFVRWWLGVMCYLARRPAPLIEEGRHMIALDATHFLSHWVRGMGLEATGALAEALAELEKAHELSGGIPFTLGFLAYVYGRAGREKDARALLDVATRAAATTYVPPFTFALGYAGLGDWGATFEWLDKAIEIRDPLIIPIKTHPFLDPVRDDPRYRALLKKMNL